MSQVLQIYLFGPPVIQWVGQDLPIPRRQVRALLYRLAAEYRPLSRGYLANFFWEDQPESTARRNLSRLLVYLARQLPDPTILQTGESRIGLDPGRTWVDTGAYEGLWESWKLRRGCQDLQAAVTLYRGPFLEDFNLPGNSEYDRWSSQEVEYWEQRYLKTLRMLINECAAQWDTAQAIEYARQYLQHNELAEEIHCQLIELYSAQGERSAALRQYEQCSITLERELGVGPMPETVAAYQAALDQKFTAAELPAGSPDWSILPGISAPLIGRQEVMERLNQSLRNAQAGQGKVLLLRGEPGIGKSRLMQEFTNRLRGRTRVISGSASPESSEMPYQVLIEALRPHLSTPEIYSNVPSSWLAEAARLLPELADLVHQPQVAIPMESGATRARIFEALCRVLFCLCEGGYTVVLCLDDLQWADATTLDYLAYLGRRLRGKRLLILGSYRSQESACLSELRQILAHQAELTELALPGLDDEETWQLVCSLGAEISADKDLAQRLQQATGGNPFFILETLRALQETAKQPGWFANLESFPIPDTVRQVVHSRLEALHPGARQVLEAGAVLGAAFDCETLLMTAGRGEMEVLDGLDELIARQFLLESAAGYHFCHAIVRETVYADLGVWRRHRLHRRAALAQEKLQRSDASALAWHFEQAGEPGKAAAYSLKAGQAARQIFAHLEARACFERALALLESEGQGLTDPKALAANHRLRIQVLYERGWALRLLGQMQAYTEDLAEVARLAQALGDPHTLAHLHWQEAYNHRWFCRYEAARAAAGKGVLHSQTSGDPFLEAVCLRELGMAARETGDYAGAQVGLEKALEIFIRLQNTTYHIHTLSNLSTLAYRRQQFEQALELSQQALLLCDQMNLRYERRLPLGDMGVAEAGLGNFEQARFELEESLSISNEIADRTQIIFCQGHLSLILMGTGQFGEALQCLQEALELAQRIGSLSEQSWLQANLAETYRVSGAYEQAVMHAQTALEIAQACQRQPDAERAQALLKQLQQKYDGAMAG
jgi:predicted ATPase/DNA-binding SARP family transcriptional activator